MIQGREAAFRRCGALHPLPSLHREQTLCPVKRSAEASLPWDTGENLLWWGNGVSKRKNTTLLPKEVQGCWLSPPQLLSWGRRTRGPEPRDPRTGCPQKAGAGPEQSATPSSSSPPNARLRCLKWELTAKYCRKSIRRRTECVQHPLWCRAQREDLKREWNKHFSYNPTRTPNKKCLFRNLNPFVLWW